MKTLNVAVIGVGNMGSAHVTCIGDGKINGMRLYAVCDLKQDILDSVKERYNCVTYKDWHDVVNDGSIDAVIIAVPHPLHADMAIALMENNKHVLCEKPIDIRVSKALKLNSVADRCDVSFAVMFNQRTNNNALCGSSPIGIAHRHITTQAAGVQPGRVRVAAYCLIRRPITLICGNGYAVCLRV